jgi:hypothetical protein
MGMPKNENQQYTKKNETEFLLVTTETSFGSLFDVTQ